MLAAVPSGFECSVTIPKLVIKQGLKLVLLLTGMCRYGFISFSGGVVQNLTTELITPRRQTVRASHGFKESYK